MPPSKSPEERKKFNRERMRKWRAENRDHFRAYQKAHRKKNRAQWRGYKGLPAPTRPEPATCECCGRPSTSTLHLDHDHVTGEFRGWLCKKCNLAIGLLGDTQEGAQRAVDYLGKR